jgi:hypothetical protein
MPQDASEGIQRHGLEWSRPGRRSERECPIVPALSRTSRDIFLRGEIGICPDKSLFI